MSELSTSIEREYLKALGYTNTNKIGSVTRELIKKLIKAKISPNVVEEYNNSLERDWRKCTNNKNPNKYIDRQLWLDNLKVFVNQKTNFPNNEMESAKTESAKFLKGRKYKSILIP